MRIYGDKELLWILREAAIKKQVIVVTHFNHPREVTEQSALAVRRLLEAGIPVRNQAVLLRGVNDDGETLGSLLKKLTSIGVIPYYIFQCRPVTGVKNQFQVPIMRGYSIVQDALNRQNGQGKSARYAMSHETGKIEFIGPSGDGSMLMKYQQAKDGADAGRIFSMRLEPGQCWIGEVPKASMTHD